MYVTYTRFAKGFFKLTKFLVEKYGYRITAMALIHCPVVESQVKNSNLKAFLHQRTRQWNYSDVTSNPFQCTSLPSDYDDGSLAPSTLAAASIMRSAQHIRWNENVQRTTVLSSITAALHHLVLSNGGSKEPQSVPVVTTDKGEFSHDQGTVCPTFGGGANDVCECVFTNTAVQQAILCFFEEVAQNPQKYRNPTLQIHNQAPQPSTDHPLELTADAMDTGFPTLQSEMTPEQAKLEEARETLMELHIALAACPGNVPELKAGYDKLATKIQRKQLEVEDLEIQILSTGGLRAGEAMEKRENWKPQAEGPKVPFAGSMVDSELLKAAGLFETAKTELDKLESGDEEKAFL